MLSDWLAEFYPPAGLQETWLATLVRMRQVWTGLLAENLTRHGVKTTWPSREAAHDYMKGGVWHGQGMLTLVLACESEPDRVLYLTPLIASPACLRVTDETTNGFATYTGEVPRPDHCTTLCPIGQHLNGSCMQLVPAGQDLGDQLRAAGLPLVHLQFAYPSEAPYNIWAYTGEDGVEAMLVLLDEVIGGIERLAVRITVPAGRPELEGLF